MPRPEFGGLRGRLLRAGIAPRHVRRAVAELQDHYEDIVDAGVADGLARPAAERRASEALGDMDTFVEAMQAQPELRSWAYRFPRIALVAYPLACLALLPAFPVFAGIAHAPMLMRWGISLMFAGFVTLAMLLVLQLAILFG